jgi:ketosteroid isomerase-like protein
MAHVDVSAEEVADLVRRAERAAMAYIRGDLGSYAALIPHSDAFTLMPPNGGDVRRGFELSDENVAATADYFRGGDARLEVVATHASGDLAVLAAVERQHGEVGAMPDQDWSLRITLVYRREEGEWRLVHRHADPLVHAVGMELVAAMARGEADPA